MICLAVTTASTDRHKDHTHQEPERAELNNTCREATSRGIPGAGSDSYCPTSSTGCWEICSVSSTGADMDMEDQPRQQHNTLRGDAPPCCTWHSELVAPFHPLISWHIPALPLSLCCLSHTKLAWQKQQFCQPSPSVQGRSNQEDGITIGKNKPTKEPPTKQKTTTTTRTQ